MEASGVRVYLLFGVISDEQRTALLERLAQTLPPNMRLSDQAWPPSIWCHEPTDAAASSAVQVRLTAICDELGIPDEQVTTSLDPNRV